MRNDYDGYLYTNKFHLYVIELNNTELASEEDKKYNIDVWARLFKATTWEEIKMITENNPSMNSTAEEIYVSNSDFIIAEQCRVREDNIIHEKLTKERLEKLTNENAALTEGMAALAEEKAVLAEEKAVLADKNASLNSELARLKKLLEDNGIKQ